MATKTIGVGTATSIPRTRLWATDMAVLADGYRAVGRGAFVVCRRGEATLSVDFRRYGLSGGGVVVLFPDEVLRLEDVSDGFCADVLDYDADILREACLHVEHTVYTVMREDRCLEAYPAAREAAVCMFAVLWVYARQQGCACFDRIVVSQLGTFFMGFHDWCRRNPPLPAGNSATRRTEELFGAFMALVERHHREWRSVAQYASQLNISAKYLTGIVRRVTGHTPKEIIDECVAHQIKLALRTSDRSVKQIAWDYNFSDNSFFCRYFKLRTGLTPQQFRREAKGR